MNFSGGWENLGIQRGKFIGSIKLLLGVCRLQYSWLTIKSSCFHGLVSCVCACVLACCEGGKERFIGVLDHSIFIEAN